MEHLERTNDTWKLTPTKSYYWTYTKANCLIICECKERNKQKRFRIVYVDIYET